MPIFEYRCPSGHTSEVIDVSNKSRLPSIECPRCGETAMKVLSTVVVKVGPGPEAKESPVSQAIRRVQRAERAGKLD